MKNNYTRQRQGRAARPAQRTFNSLLEEVNHLRNAEMSAHTPPSKLGGDPESAGYNSIDGIIGNAPAKDDYDEKTLLEQIEYNRAVSERNAAPIDGHEPQERSR